MATLGVQTVVDKLLSVLLRWMGRAGARTLCPVCRLALVSSGVCRKCRPNLHMGRIGPVRYHYGRSWIVSELRQLERRYVMLNGVFGRQTVTALWTWPWGWLVKVKGNGRRRVWER